MGGGHLSGGNLLDIGTAARVNIQGTDKDQSDGGKMEGSTQGQKNCRRPEGTEKIKVRMRGLMVLKSGGAGALATVNSTLPRVWREAGMKRR
jgi:hypothetical protein